MRQTIIAIEEETSCKMWLYFIALVFLVILFFYFYFLFVFVFLYFFGSRSIPSIFCTINQYHFNFYKANHGIVLSPLSSV